MYNTAEKGDIVAILSSDIEGYKIVQCVASKPEKFSGKHYKCVKESDNSFEFELSSKLDVFTLSSIVYKLNLAEKIVSKSGRMVVTKQEIDSSLLQVTAVDDIE